MTIEPILAIIIGGICGLLGFLFAEALAFWFRNDRKP